MVRIGVSTKLVSQNYADLINYLVTVRDVETNTTNAIDSFRFVVDAIGGVNHVFEDGASEAIKAITLQTMFGFHWSQSGLWIDDTNEAIRNEEESASENEDDQSGSLSRENTSMSITAPLSSPFLGSNFDFTQSENTSSPWQTGFRSTPDSTSSNPAYIPAEPAFSHVIHHESLPTDIPSRGEVSTAAPRQAPPLQTENSAWPIKDAAEARLFEHYVLDLARWLDLCDPQGHFQYEVPKRAAKCPVLLKAILALSARQLTLTKRETESNEIAANQHYGDCIQLLIPVITRADENIFAALIILRVFEEIDVFESDGTQGLAHIAGIQSFVRGHGSNLMQGGLGEAAFWVGLRQEIYVATIMHRAVQIEIRHINRSVVPLSDFDWANRAVVHLADVLNCCFGHGVDPEQCSRLQIESDRWQNDKPNSFSPYYYRGADRSKGEAFPEILHIHPCHIVGIQHHKLAQILLSIFSLRSPQSRNNSYEAENPLLINIKQDLREICGIGLHNRATPPGMFTACMGIAMCGDRFDDRLEQEALLQLLIETENDHARPTAAIQKHMKLVWGWNQESIE
ncbi:uncharacterized protein RCO7_09899 [Rhynchosporium graminicola]|uniref:ARCA protein n=1 Tax=Rhynchosporium graminicola TaxID=2792576 RepID=A0A1E1LKY4_9HELO|nr:uncharacterized protein RCO7_09899 [Rhynchosporium commune]